MSLPFSGPAAKLSPGDIDQAARDLNCPREAVQAVLTVETGGAGGFLADGSGRPRILFEAYRFSRATGGQYNASHPLISSGVPNWKLYRGGAAEYERLAEAYALNPDAAIECASWGLFQVMGANWESLAYGSPANFAEQMAEGEGQQLEAFVGYVIGNGLDEALSALDWARFARGYNGPAYAVNRYDVRLRAAFQQASGAPVDAMLRIGATGRAVRDLQLKLINYGFSPGAADGIFGRATEYAVRRFQSMMGLAADGVAGPRTLAALRLRSAP